MNWLHSLLGNFGIAIMAPTVSIKPLFFRWRINHRSMSAMKKLQPEMALIRERVGDDRAKLNQEMDGVQNGKRFLAARRF